MMTTLDMNGYGISLLNRTNQQYDLEDFNGYTTWFTRDYYDPRKGFGSREFAGNHQN